VTSFGIVVEDDDVDDEDEGENPSRWDVDEDSNALRLSWTLIDDTDLTCSGQSTSISLSSRQSYTAAIVPVGDSIVVQVVVVVVRCTVPAVVLDRNFFYSIVIGFALVNVCSIEGL
jgi:hypothetical protein